MRWGSVVWLYWLPLVIPVTWGLWALLRRRRRALASCARLGWCTEGGAAVMRLPWAGQDLPPLRTLRAHVEALAAEVSGVEDLRTARERVECIQAVDCLVAKQARRQAIASSESVK